MKVSRLSALRTGRLYPPRKYSWYSFLLDTVSTPSATVRPKGLCKRKISVTSGIEPGTHRLVAQCQQVKNRSFNNFLMTVNPLYKRTVEYFPSNSTVTEWISIDHQLHINLWSRRFYWLFSILNVDRQNTVFSGHNLHSKCRILRFNANKK